MEVRRQGVPVIRVLYRKSRLVSVMGITPIERELVQVRGQGWQGLGLHRL